MVREHIKISYMDKSIDKLYKKYYNIHRTRDIFIFHEKLQQWPKLFLQERQ